MSRFSAPVTLECFLLIWSVFFFEPTVCLLMTNVTTNTALHCCCCKKCTFFLDCVFKVELKVHEVSFDFLQIHSVFVKLTHGYECFVLFWQTVQEYGDEHLSPHCFPNSSQVVLNVFCSSNVFNNSFRVFFSVMLIFLSNVANEAARNS